MMARVALITGGTRGIGKAIAQNLAENGCDLFLVYRSNDQAAEACRDTIQSASHRRVTLFKCDVSSESSVGKLSGDLARQTDRLDVLVNNAGVMPRHYPIESIPTDEWNDLIANNLTSIFFLTKALLPLLRKAAPAHIINLSSIAGQTGGTIGVGYAASKGAVISMTQALAKELAPGIQVNCIAPGPVDTEFLGDELKRKLKDLDLLKRIVAPEEVARAVRFLIESPSVTGQCVTLNGGRYMSR